MTDQTNVSTPVPQNSAGGLNAFAAAMKEALSGDNHEPDPTEGDIPADSPEENPLPAVEKKPASKPKKLKELSSYAKLTDDELYAIEVPSSIEGQEPYTLGKLKDLAKEHDDFTLAGLQREQEFRDREARLLSTEAELRDILASIPKEAIPDKLRGELQSRRDKAVREERQRVLEVIPGWQDREVRTQELAAMIEHLKGHGFPESYLPNVLDHRTLRYIRSNMVRERNLAAALAKVTKRKASTPAKSAKSAAPSKPQANGGRPATREERQHANFANVLFATKS